MLLNNCYFVIAIFSLVFLYVHRLIEFVFGAGITEYRRHRSFSATTCLANIQPLLGSGQRTQQYQRHILFHWHIIVEQ